MKITINNETLDDELIMLNLDGFEDEELLILLKMLYVKIGTNRDAYFKVKQWGEDYGIDEIIEYAG